jgi:hypothetical protein
MELTQNVAMSPRKAKGQRNDGALVTRGYEPQSTTLTLRNRRRIKSDKPLTVQAKQRSGI